MIECIEVKGTKYYIDVTVRKRFESIAGTDIKQPITPAAMHALIESCVDATGNPDYEMRNSLVEWLCIWRGMSPKLVGEVRRICDPARLKDLAPVAAARRLQIAASAA